MATGASSSRERQLEELAAARRLVAELESQLGTERLDSRHRNMLETLLDNVPDYIYFKDAERRFVLASKQFCRLFGRGFDEIIGKTDEDLFPPEIASETSNDDLTVIRTGVPLICKEEGSDELGWVLTTKVPWRDEQGEVIGLVGISRDITERRSEERARREADQHYRQLLEHSPTVTWVTDADGRTSFISANAEAVYGFGVEEILAAGEALWLGRIHPDDREPMKRAFEALFAERVPFDVQYRIQRKDGEWIWIHDRANVMAHEEGRLRAYGAFTDVTLQKRAEAERLELERHLARAQRLESLGVLASGLAHDFNNLLLAIQGNLNLALIELEAGAGPRERITDATTIVTRAAELVAQMLAYAGKGRQRLEAVDLNAVVREMVAMLGSEIPERTSVQLELSPELLTFRGDATQARQVVMNLVTNAAQAIGDQPGELVLRTSIAECRRKLLDELRPDHELPEGDYLCLEVRDTGNGMEDSVRERIFDPFFSTKPKGSGLGLSVVHGIVRKHHGAIRVESAPGDGSTFTIWLPRA